MRPAIIAASVVVGVLALYLIASVLASGGNSGRPAPPWLTKTPFAHRGLHDSVARPENSLAAFAAAVQAGYGVELDVHLSSDGTVVVFHDHNLMRMTGDPREVADVTARELAGLSLAGTAERIPTLSQALETIDGRVPLIIEIKNPGEVGDLEDAVAREISGYRGDVAVMSFNPFTVSRIRQVSPQTVRGQLAGPLKGEDLPFYQKIVLRNLWMNRTSRPDFVAYDLRGMPSWITFVQRLRSTPLLVWTADNPGDVEKARKLADNLIANPGGLSR